ncbi:Hypothetical predicted protein, partial [Olea europaea subsp. europaea]
EEEEFSIGGRDCLELCEGGGEGGIVGCEPGIEEAVVVIRGICGVVIDDTGTAGAETEDGVPKIDKDMTVGSH